MAHDLRAGAEMGESCSGRRYSICLGGRITQSVFSKSSNLAREGDLIKE